VLRVEVGDGDVAAHTKNRGRGKRWRKIPEIPLVANSCIFYWPEIWISTVNDCTFDDFPAQRCHT